jgi:hypothetical protein
MKWSLERKGKANSSPMAQNDTREDSCLDRHPEHSEGSVFPGQLMNLTAK